jgi:RNA polymerase sigma-70 factor (ECF subfamily)
MTEGPAAGLAVLDAAGADPRLEGWPQLYIARAELQRRLGRPAEAVAAYRSALRLDLPAGERAFVDRRIRAILADCDFLNAGRHKPAGQ